jgi:hypothetical protein
VNLDLSGETSGTSPYFAPGFALGYAALVADFWGPKVAEDAVRLFVAHAYTDTSAYGFSPDHWHPWTLATIFPTQSLTTYGWRGPCVN